MDATELKARQLLRDAETAELNGNFEEAIRCYKKAYFLCPKLENEGRADDDEAEEENDAMVKAGMRDVNHYERLPPSDSGHRTFDATALFHTSDAELRDSTRTQAASFFEEMGYIVLDNALSTNEVDTALARFHQFMMASGVDTTSKASMDQLFADPGLGITSKCGAGHSSMNWFVRSRQAVKDSFRFILNAQKCANDSSTPSLPTSQQMSREQAMKLITSFDGFNYFRNPEVGGELWGGSSTSWFHFDADDHTNCHYVQGIVNLIDCQDEADAGLLLLPKSHRTLYPKVVFEKERENPSYMTHLGKAEKAVYRALDLGSDVPFRVPLKAGSLVMWKASVLHCNTGCLPRATPNPEQLIRRLACYICMQEDPEEETITQRRQEAFSRGLGTTHQPDLCRVVSTGAPTQAALDAKVVLTSLEELPEGAAELL